MTDTTNLRLEIREHLIATHAIGWPAARSRDLLQRALEALDAQAPVNRSIRVPLTPIEEARRT
jgi:hypothetical protein